MAEQQEIFAADELEAIAKALGDTSEGLTGSEIRHILQLAQLCDVDPAATKWKRIHGEFKRSSQHVLASKHWSRFGGSSPHPRVLRGRVSASATTASTSGLCTAQIGSFREVLSKQVHWCSRSFRVAKGCAVSQK